MLRNLVSASRGARGRRRSRRSRPPVTAAWLRSDPTAPRAVGAAVRSRPARAPVRLGSPLRRGRAVARRGRRGHASGSHRRSGGWDAGLRIRGRQRRGCAAQTQVPRSSDRWTGSQRSWACPEGKGRHAAVLIRHATLRIAVRRARSGCRWSRPQPLMITLEHGEEALKRSPEPRLPHRPSCAELNFLLVTRPPYSLERGTGCSSKAGHW